MFKYFLIFIGVYILYRFIFHFVLPVASAARQMNRKMKAFQQEQQEMYRQQQAATNPAPRSQATSSPDDYLDFEEVK